MPSGSDTPTVAVLKTELEASMIKIDTLEQENHDLKQEINRLRTQLNALRAHDLERKSMLWKKLHNSLDSGKLITDEQPQKPKIQVDHFQFQKRVETTNDLPKPPPLPPQRLQRRATVPPPLPPPLPSSPAGSKTVRRVPAVMEFYRSLMNIDTQKENKHSVTGVMNCRDMIGEIENRSTYLTSIKSDVEKYGELVNFLIGEVETASFTEISDVEVFVKWLDGELSCLVDERGVLKHFPKWPERKADALREAAFSYRDLKNLESQVLSSFTNTRKQALIQSLKNIQALQDRVESRIGIVERTREGTSKKYKELQIPWQWLMDTGLVGQIKISSLKLARECMTRITKELESKEEGSREDRDLVLQGVRFAYRIHQFAGGFDAETIHAFQQLKQIGTKTLINWI